MKWFLLFLGVWSGIVVGADSKEQGPRFLVHLLDYMALDYPGAVQNGHVISKSEYAEQKEFAASALNTAKSLPTLGVERELVQLNGMVDRKVPAEQIRSMCREIEGTVIKVAGIQVAPVNWPNRLQGKKIYNQTCVVCHGASGHGDGLAGGRLNPPPANFHDPKMAAMPPFQLFNAIRLGVPGTGMVAYPQYSDAEIWALAFYVNSLRYEGTSLSTAEQASPGLPNDVTLKDVASLSDGSLASRLPGGTHAVARVRLWVPKDNEQSSTKIARADLDDATGAFRRGDMAEAKKKAVMAYLDGVEPIEPQLRVKDSAFTASLETSMAEVRSAIEGERPVPEVEAAVKRAILMLGEADTKLGESQGGSWWLTFTVAAGIFLREAFEAILIIITLLGVLNSIGVRRAAWFVHVGWILAVGLGVLTWFFSGWLIGISGAQREILEGSISLFAVFVLLYVGFWLHRKTEIGKWRAFIDQMVKTAVKDQSLIGLGVISFMAVFREMFEVVLFLRVLLVESGSGAQGAMALGVGLSFIVVLACAAWLVKFSARIPIRQLFSLSSLVMMLLAFILMGKAIHSFQETGFLPVTLLPIHFELDLIGLYSSWETLLPQVAVLALSLLVWFTGARSSKRACEPNS